MRRTSRLYRHDWSYEVTQRKINANSTNGTAYGHASPTHDDFAMHMNRAASDDASGSLAAGPATSAGACAGRDAYAELAPAEASPTLPAQAEGKRLRPPGAASRTAGGANGGNAANASANGTDYAAPRGSRSSRAEKIESTISVTPPGTEPLPLDGAAFVEAVHERVDLIALEEQLLRSADEKIVQRELAYLRELRYGKTAAFSSDDDIPPRLIFDAPDPTSP
jgi:hypothetical protein